ncbi:hypothetical protein DENSPDRAFT_416105 [Dentipellis sp. KUC8613]|nr:hypothetical protein DENSPDRAFT_416105 [Dentipellis sp. KUC8613]
MDPLGIATSVITTAIAIESWIDQHRKKEESLSELRHTVSRLAVILAPLQTDTDRTSSSSSSQSSDAHSESSTPVSVSSSIWNGLDPAITTCLQDMREILGRIQDDLVLWKDKRSKKVALLEFLRPSLVLGRIQDDEQRLARRSDTLSFALQVYFLRKAHEQAELRAVQARGPPPSALDEVRNAEVKRFWEERVGGRMSFIDGAGLCRELGAWLGIRLDKTTSDTLLLRLDEFAVGGTGPSSLDEFVGQRSIRRAIASLGNIESLALARQFEPLDPSTVRPLLVWIDDRPEGNDGFFGIAERQGIELILLTSTASAKVWAEENEARLRQADYANRLRFISDNCRWEATDEGGGVVENLTAGEAILRYLRGRLYHAPVLIYCGYSILQTKYVLSFSRAGSTTQARVTLEYIRALGRGESQDRAWEYFNIW